MKLKISNITALLLMLMMIGSLFIVQSHANLKPNQDDGEDSGSGDHHDGSDSGSSDNSTETHTEDNHDNQTQDGSVSEHEREQAYERQVHVENQDTEMQIESSLHYNHTEEKYQASFKIADGAPRVEMKYSTENNTGETQLKYRVQFQKIIEFNESGTTPGFDQNDTVLSTYDLSQVDWQKLNYSTITVNGSTVHQAVAKTTDGIFTIKLYVTGGFAKVNGSTVTPNAVKLDIEIHQYPYNGSNSYLSLQTDVSTESNFEVHHQTEEEKAGFANNESELAINNTQASGFFSWVDTAMADGTMVNVLNSGLLNSSVEGHDNQTDLQSGERKGYLYFTFDAANATNIVWDPKVGVVSQGAQANLEAIISSLGTSLPFDPSTLPGMELWIAVVSIFSMSALSMFRKRKFI